MKENTSTIVINVAEGRAWVGKTEWSVWPTGTLLRRSGAAPHGDNTILRYTGPGESDAQFAGVVMVADYIHLSGFRATDWFRGCWEEFPLSKAAEHIAARFINLLNPDTAFRLETAILVQQLIVKAIP